MVETLFAGGRGQDGEREGRRWIDKDSLNLIHRTKGN